MVPPVHPALAALPAAPLENGDPLAWDLAGLRFPGRAAALLAQVAARLPYFVPRTGLLLLDWQPVGHGGRWRVQPRLDMHAVPWVTLPVAAIRPTGAVIHAAEEDGEPVYTLQMPGRRGRPGARVPLATGLMRLSMQAHDEHARFLPVVLRTALTEDRYGELALHLHGLDIPALVSREVDPALRRTLARQLAERVLGLMSVPGSGLAREAPMLLHDD